MNAEPQESSYFRGVTGLIAVLAVIAILVLWLPAYRWFLLISAGIGILVAGALYLWHRFKPLKEEDVDNKRPLGLELLVKISSVPCFEGLSSQLLSNMRVISRFLMSASDPNHFPAPTLPEVAFLGRSNVGKSSVINSLLGAKVAKTSSTPGLTRSINSFEVRWPGKPNPELIFADL